jgi:hypothetical protein
MYWTMWSAENVVPSAATGNDAKQFVGIQRLLPPVTRLTDKSYPPSLKTSTQQVPGDALIPLRSPASGAERKITLVDGNLSIRLERAPLRAVLDEIATKSGVDFVVSTELGAALVNTEIYDAGLVEALATLLQDFDTYYFFAAKKPRSSLQTVWVYPKGHATTSSQASPSVDFARQLAADQEPRSLINNLQFALHDHDPVVRYRTLADSEALGVTLPAQTLQQMATGDRDVTVRILAMTKFAQDPEVDLATVKAVVEVGLHDSDGTINAHARALLEQLDRASRSDHELTEILPGDPPVE